MTRKIFSIITALALCLGLMPGTAGAEEMETTPQAETITVPLDFTNVGNDEGQTLAEGPGYQTFCRMYQLEVRRQKRLDNSVHLMLVTLVGSDGEFLPLDRRRTEMEILGKIISGRMRLGNVYCRYSASQYLILAMDTTEEQAEAILERIRDAYAKARPDAGARLVPHQCCPLAAAEALGDGAADGGGGPA